MLKAGCALASLLGFLYGHFQFQVCHLPGLFQHICYLTSELPLVILFLSLKTMSPLAINSDILMCGFFSFFALGLFVG